MKTSIHNTMKYTSLLLMLFAFTSAFAQKDYKLAAEPKLTVAGTSSIHDWEMVSKDAVGKGQFKVENGSITDAKDVKVVMKATSLKSGKSAMDDNTYKALKNGEHPNISFQLDKIVSENNGKLVASGTLNIAGVNRKATFTCTYKVDGNKINLVGNTAFKLTDYQIDPPTAVFGTIKTGNEVEISFNVVFIS